MNLLIETAVELHPKSQIQDFDEYFDVSGVLQLGMTQKYSKVEMNNFEPSP